MDTSPEPDVTAPDAQKWFDLQTIEEELGRARWLLASLRVEMILNDDRAKDQEYDEALSFLQGKIDTLLRYHASV
jgi:putative AlgH/UPF0301 family transcriptional regulator